MLHAKTLCHASYDLGFYTVTNVAWHMSHATYVVVWAHLKCVEMGKLDCGMSIYIPVSLSIAIEEER